MNPIRYTLKELKEKTVPIGREGENEYTVVSIDCAEVYEEYPAAVASMKVQNPNKVIYPVVIERSGNDIIWTVKASDLTVKGDGRFQLTFTEGTVIHKTVIGRTLILKSLVGDGPVPEAVEDWIDEATELMEDMEEKRDSGYFKGDPGEPGEPGAPGHSPVLTADKVGKTTTIYSDGTQLAQILDGQDGQAGAIIDDTAPAADKVFSSSKVNGELNTVKSALNVIEGENILDISTRTAGVIFTGSQSSNYTSNINATTLAMQDSSVTNAVKANVTGSTKIRIEKSYSSRFIIGTFTAEPVNGSVGLRRIDNAASITSYDLTLTSEEKWLLIVYFHNSEDSSRDLTTIKNSIKITSLDEGEKYSKTLDNIGTKATESHTALGLDAPVNLFDPSGDTANLMLTINQGSLLYVTSSKVHGLYCQVPSNTLVSISKPVSSRFVVGTSISAPANGVAVTQVFDVNSAYTKYSLTTGANDKYLFVAYFHNDEDTSRDIDTIRAGIKVFEGSEWRDGVSNFLHPLSAMPGYMTKLLSYKPLGTLTKPYICLSCDDGEATLATDTIPALKGYKTTYGQNIPVTFGLLNTSPVITNNTYKALVQEMVSDYGCSVAVHGDVTLTNLDELGLQDELKTQKNALVAAGFTPNGIIYPQHHFNELVCAVAGGQYGVCCTGGNYTDLTYGAGNACGPRSNMYALYRLSLLNSSMTTQKIHDYVDYIETNNMLMCAFWHDSSFAANHALLDELVSYAISKGIDFITIGDILTIV